MLNEKLGRAILAFLTDPALVRARLSWPLFSFASYSMLTSLSRQGLRPQTIIDVGANIGQFAVASSRTFPKARIYAIEPQPDCFDLLKQNTASLSNVETHRYAIGNTTGEVTLHVNSHRHSSSILELDENHKLAFPEALETATISVPLTTLDLLIGPRPIQRPCLLKLDIQGYEPQALEGCKNLVKSIDHIVMEVSFRSLYKGELLFNDMVRLMDQYHFSLLRPLDWLSDPRTGEILQMDALFGPVHSKPS